MRMNDVTMGEGVTWRGVDIPLKRSVGGPRRAFFLSDVGIGVLSLSLRGSISSRPR